MVFGVRKLEDMAENEINALKQGGVLPDIEHPSYIHDWLEKPELRASLEALEIF